jgi:phosphatidylglycerol:prolipoprotein diacylglycerol transferase
MDLGAYPEATTRFHPLFAYEAILNLVGFFLILWVARRFAHRLFDGDVLMLYLVWYSAVRIYLETFRVENWIIAGLPAATWVGIISIILAVGVLAVRHARGWGEPGAWIREKAEREAQAAARAKADASATEPTTEATPG